MNYEGMSYEEMMATRTYAVLRSHRGKEPADIWEKVEASGLSWKDATAKANELSAAEHALHPEQTSWSRDLFEQRLEQGAAINKELQRRRMERCQQYQKQGELFGFEA